MLLSMIWLAKPSVLCVVVCALIVSVDCTTLPACKPLRNSLYPPVSACKQFVKLLEDPQFCNLDQAQNCCVLVDAAVTNHCHCWQGFSSATLGLFELLQKHCKERYQADDAQQSEIKVFIGVLTGSANALQRQAVRDTWAKHAKGHRVVFFSAVPANETVFDMLRSEASAEQDVVVLTNIQESYYNITHQTLEMCRMAAMDPSITHLLKVDDDSYVHMTRLMGRLKALPRQKLFLGYIEKAGGTPHRDPANRWHVPIEEWPWETFPAWAHGAGYAITKDIVNEIAAGAAMKIQNHTLFRLEDIAMGAWVDFVGKEKGWYIQMVKDKRFNFNGCLANDLVSHYMPPPQMHCMYEHDGRCCVDGHVVQTNGIIRSRKLPG